MQYEFYCRFGSLLNFPLIDYRLGQLIGSDLAINYLKLKLRMAFLLLRKLACYEQEIWLILRLSPILCLFFESVIFTIKYYFSGFNRFDNLILIFSVKRGVTWELQSEKLPHNIMYKITPQDQMSHFSSYFPFRTSGAT